MDAIYSIPKNKNGQEILKRGTPLFPCSSYNRDIRQYITCEIPAHWHYEMEIFFLIEGNAHISLVDSEFDLRPGEGYFVNSNVLHGISCAPDTSLIYHSIVFDPCIISGASGSAYDILYIRPFIEQGSSAWIFRPDDKCNDTVISELFQTAFEACENKDIGYEFIIRDALSSIILLLNGHLNGISCKQSTQQELRMKQMLSWLDEHYMEQITISDLANATGICIRECQRCFSKILHITPMQYLTRRRISAASKLLVSTNLPIIEIGICCGFENHSYFSKQFKNITGMTPREYRKKNCTSNKDFNL
ncbi:AraC family transcriptional regulator [Clostridium sp. D53t1_180928_C8]|uniref:helix-turn-helix transcriptional regulator n=1 Tax=Clostridium sp. D53t1_180928_C8 TaxID=2787101 RepID=UPI0018AB5EDF|nr:AraC family transcriptional regulator [Clostridium sp. D53t1_180928_C8]